MKEYILFILLLFFSPVQRSSDAYQFTSNTTVSLKDGRINFQKAAWEYSFVGDYQKALWAFDQEVGSYPALTNEQKKYFSSFKKKRAHDYIVSRAENEKIIMTNEAHHQPMHRTFTTSLLNDLYQKGYRFLGLEALAHEDTLLNERGYPVLSSGYYTKEPQFGNLIREALKIGYTVFPYETQVWGDGKEREIQQAKNIHKMIESHPEGKFLIHCGFDHINETEGLHDWGKAMAGRVKEFTGIDPFTINQEILTEHYLVENENPYYLIVDSLQQASVFTKENEVFRGDKEDERFDVRLFHPRTNYLSGRPDWLLMNGEREIYMIDPKSFTINYPVIVKAYLSQESESAVPVDVIEIKDFSDHKALVLPIGEYRVLIENMNGDSVVDTVKIE